MLLVLVFLFAGGDKKMFDEVLDLFGKKEKRVSVTTENKYVVSFEEVVNKLSLKGKIVSVKVMDYKDDQVIITTEEEK